MNLTENYRSTMFSYITSLLGYRRAMQLQDQISQTSMKYNQSVHLSHFEGGFVHKVEEAIRVRMLVEPLSCLIRWSPFHPLNQATVEKSRQDERKKLDAQIRTLTGPERASRSTAVRTFLYKRDKFNAEECVTRVVAMTLGNAVPKTELTRPQESRDQRVRKPPQRGLDQLSLSADPALDMRMMQERQVRVYWKIL